jgi:hypothetical protein
MHTLAVATQTRSGVIAEESLSSQQQRCYLRLHILRGA